MIENINDMNISIDENNPIYKAFDELLKEKDEFIIDDDKTEGLLEKTMKVSKNKNDIKINFNNSSHQDYNLDVNVNGINYDAESKIGNNPRDNDTKMRLMKLFKNLEIIMAPKEKLEDILLPNSESSLRYIDIYKEDIFKIVPEFKELDGLEIGKKLYGYDLCEHTLDTIRKSAEENVIRLAILLHDIAKPHSLMDDKSAELSDIIMTRLGYDEANIKEVHYLIKNYNKKIDINNVNKNNAFTIMRLLHIQYCDAYNQEESMQKYKIMELDKIKTELSRKISNFRTIELNRLDEEFDR